MPRTNLIKIHLGSGSLQDGILTIKGNYIMNNYKRNFQIEAKWREKDTFKFPLKKRIQHICKAMSLQVHQNPFKHPHHVHHKLFTKINDIMLYDTLHHHGKLHKMFLNHISPSSTFLHS
ncbi:unnamed protein product [Vicia faba]|uniref:Uncharacterized protein n=1 Tax=Vicia faba TaxID=3906 RepID=A0AAV1A4I5_VICFA|nr:unnamed protein product [Vicia faba]